MPRIPETDIERLKNDISVERLVESAGIELKKSGKDKIGQCPFHEDNEPSLVVTPAKNLWHCFGCQCGGGPIDWVMKFKGISFRHAVELFKADPSLAAAGVAPVKRSIVRNLPAPVAFDADDQSLLNQTIGYYHETLKQAPEALAYLKERGLDSAELIDCFVLGYANRSLGLRLPTKIRQDGAAIRTRLEKIGIYRASGHEHFNGSLIVPIMDAAGDVTEVYGRKIRDDLRKGTPAHLYLPGPHRGVWNEQALATSKEIILCEALIDAMTFWCAGFKNVTAAYGVEGFTDDHLAAFKRHATSRVLIAYDRDDAGELAAAKLAEQLIAQGIECLRVKFPKGMDANSYALKLTPAHQSLALVLRQAEWIGRGPRPDMPAAPQNLPDPEPMPSPFIPLAAAVAVESSAALTQGPATEPATGSPNAGDELTFSMGDRQWRVRGWQKNLTPEQMRVNLQVRRTSADGSVDSYHVDTLDLYAARARAAYIKQAAVEIGIADDTVKRDLGQVLLKVETLQDDSIRQTRQPKSKTPILSEQEERAALDLLRSPELITRIVTDMEACGVVGEAGNLLAGYLAAVSRKLDTPLAILIQSSSAAGKSSLMDAVLAMMPMEERIQYSAMTGQSLFYLGETDIQHKILAIAEEEGIRQAAYALKLLQSDGALTMASTGKDEVSGNLTTKSYTVKGPVMLMLTTTAIDVDEELMNRCLVLTVNESREQTQAIHARQRMKQTLAGMLAANDKQAITALHQNAQRLLRSVHVVNPYADQLTFLDDKTRMRRDHMKYLTLIRAITLLHQHQRKVHTVEHRGQSLHYIEATKEDIALANRIAHDVLGRTLDELPPQTRRLLTLLQAWVAQRCKETGVPAKEWRFTRRELRDATQWGDTQLKLHLTRLTELEYLMVHRRGTTFEYELVYDGAADGNPHLCGLIDVSTLDYDGKRSGQNGYQSPPNRPQVGERSGDGRSDEIHAGTGDALDLPEFTEKTHFYTNGHGPADTVVPAAIL